MTDNYRKPGDMPAVLPVFPLRGVILLPRSTLPLNVFEPRYLTLVNDILGGERLLGIVQTAAGECDEESPPEDDTPLKTIGCAGRLTAFQETDDNRYLVSLSGIARFAIRSEQETAAPYRCFAVDFKPFAGDFEHGRGEDAVDRKRLLKVLRDYLETNDLSADWESINRSANELLVNTLSMISPYGPEEKQALLEAGTLKERAEVLMALAEMEMAAGDNGSGTTLQ